MFIRHACTNCFKIINDSFLSVKNSYHSRTFHFSNFFYKQLSARPWNSFVGEVYYFSTSSHIGNIHTTKGWKILARTGLKKDEVLKTDELPLSCEEGSDAVPHSVLTNELQKCKTVAQQVETFSSLITLTSEDVKKRKEFCYSLEKAFQPYFSDYKVHLFGSSINGLGFKGSDVDISFQTVFDNQGYLQGVKEVPTLQSVLFGDIPKETINRLHPQFLLRFVRRILRQDCKDIKEPILYIKARCPILRFYNAKFDLYCDFSCENEASLRNTKLVRILCLLDKRFAVLTQVIRYWGKLGRFVGDIDQFNSYAFSLLVVHFLQHTDPPVLPPIKDIIENSEYLMHCDIHDEKQLYEDLKKLKPSQNKQPVDELLREYFFYFLNFDYSRIMLPLTSSLVPQRNFLPSVTDSSDAFMFSPVAVQDPFRLNFNTTAGAIFRSCRKFLNGIMEACKVYQNPSVWDTNTEMWGVSSLLITPMSEDAIMKEWQTNRTLTINLPLKLKSDIVKNIFQEGLLIECSEFKDKESSLKMNCKVYNNTWQGRNWIQKNSLLYITDVLKRENWISKEVLKSRDEYKKQVMFTFVCKCYENIVDNRLDIVLSFPDSKCNPVIAVFLKEYIPTMYKELVT